LDKHVESANQANARGNNTFSDADSAFMKGRTLMELAGLDFLSL